MFEMVFLTWPRAILDMIIFVNQKLFGGFVNMANKQDLIAKVAEAELKKDSAAAVDAVFAAVTDIPCSKKFNWLVW